MEQVEAVRRMQDYIEAHLHERITPADLARASLFSPWHSYRLFVNLVGMTPAGYIRRLRLSKSALGLRRGLKVADAAFAAGFGSVDGYQRAFFREFGCNPGDYAADPGPIEEVQTAVKRYDPALIGCAWDDRSPRIQLEPIGTRGYIELWPVRPA